MRDRHPSRVLVDRERGLVVKAFPPGRDGAQRATTEAGRLRRLHAALEDVEGVTCPRALDLVLEPEPRLTMTFVDGRPMVDHLADPTTTAAEVERLVSRLVVAVAAYAASTGEPVPDLHFRNMLVVRGAEELVLLDLGDPARPPARRGAPEPGAEVGAEDRTVLDPVLASFIGLAGSTLFECARPGHALRRRANRATARAAGAALAAAGPTPTDDATRTRVLAACRRHARGGSSLRQAWYRTAGAVLIARYRPLVLG